MDCTSPDILHGAVVQHYLVEVHVAGTFLKSIATVVERQALRTPPEGSGSKDVPQKCGNEAYEYRHSKAALTCST